MSINDAAMSRALQAAARQLPGDLYAILIVGDTESGAVHTVGYAPPGESEAFLRVALKTLQKQVDGLPKGRIN